MHKGRVWSILYIAGMWKMHRWQKWGKTDKSGKYLANNLVIWSCCNVLNHKKIKNVQNNTKFTLSQLLTIILYFFLHKNHWLFSYNSMQPNVLHPISSGRYSSGTGRLTSCAFFSVQLNLFLESFLQYTPQMMNTCSLKHFLVSEKEAVLLLCFLVAAWATRSLCWAHTSD